jgi:hypothetical protein
MPDAQQPEPCAQAKYWQARFFGMRRTYRERYNEGLSMEEWHAKHCAAFVAAKDMQNTIAQLCADLDGPADHPHFISAQDVVRRLHPLLPKPSEIPPACNHEEHPDV